MEDKVLKKREEIREEDKWLVNEIYSSDEVWEKEFEEDDNMYYCLKEYYENLNNKDIPKKYRNRILEFSNIFGRIIE